MKNKIIYKYLGKVLIGFSILLILPIIVSIIYKESFLIYLIPLCISLLTGLLLNFIKIENKNIYAKDGFIIVALSWIIISIISALPFCLSGHASFIDALFESVSGLTTTGASIFNNVEVLEKSLLFWRCFTHYIGGMGVLAFVMAIIPLSKGDKSMYVLKAEMPGPTVAKLVPSIKKTLFYLYGIYLGLTLLEIVLLLVGGMPLFDSILLSMSTAGTGGFSLLNSSIATYSTYSKYVIAIFMFLFGVNFNLYFLMLMKDFKSALKSEELKAYILMFLGSVIFITLNTITLFSNLKDAIIFNIFHVSSVMTSTGFNIGDVNIYPTSCRILILCLMVISACAGSTCGGFKISRLLICLKVIKRDFLKAIHPNCVHIVKYEGKKVEEDTINATCTYLFLYAILMLIITMIISLDGFTLEQTVNAVFSTFANVGFSFEISTMEAFSNLSKLALTIGMLLGRLEIIPLIVLFSDLRK